MRVETISSRLALLQIVLALSASAAPPDPCSGEARHRASRESAAAGVDLLTSSACDRSEAARGVATQSVAWLESARLSGDWGGVRTRIEERSVTIEASSIIDWSKPLKSGPRSRDTARGLLDINLTFDLDRTFGLSGGTLFLDAYLQRGRNGSDDTGDVQGYSNIDSEDRSQLAELWYQQYLFREKLRIKIGKLDANSEFAFVDNAAEFINSSAGFSPTIFPLPTYPDPAMSVNVFVSPLEWLHAGIGLYDGAGAVDGVRTGRAGPETFFSNSESDDYFLIGEIAWLWEGGRFALGPWFHTGEFERFDGGSDNQAVGYFALTEHRLWRENPHREADEQGLAAFLQYGWADKHVSEAVHHIGVGSVWSGAIPMRDEDAVGLMLSWVDLSSESGASKNETAIEFFYLCRPTGFLVLKGDLQYVLNPSGQSDADDIVVGTLRLEVSF
jgi:carbohydrate-selective porin OprB